MVTVDQALRKGHRMVTIPGYLILLTLSATSIVLNKIHIISDNQILPALGISILISWLYWSFRITKWRLWSYSHVEDHEELTLKAIEQKLIWREGSIFEKTEIRNKKDQAKWKLIQKKHQEHHLKDTRK